jgi:hypothetical protein
MTIFSTPQAVIERVEHELSMQSGTTMNTTLTIRVPEPCLNADLRHIMVGPFDGVKTLRLLWDPRDEDSEEYNRGYKRGYEAACIALADCSLPN